MFKSILSNEMAAFLEIRKFAVDPNNVNQDKIALIALDEHLVQNDYHKKELTEDVFDALLPTLKDDNKRDTLRRRVISIRVFTKYLNVLGIPSFLPNVPVAKSDYIPYIYADDEIALLVYYADNLQVKMPKASSPYLTLKIPMILRILYGCGTRIGETLALRRKDIDFKAHTLFLRETKYSKERRIPVHDTLISILEKYCLAIGIMPYPEAYLFPADNHKKGCHFSSRQVLVWFKELLRLANIDQRDKKPGERGAALHCFRHVFVLKSMQQLEAAGHSVDVNDLILPTYLGHKCLLDTDKYMKFSGAQFPESLDAFESFTAGLIPKVGVPYED